MKNFSTQMQNETCEFPFIIERHIQEQSVVKNIVVLLKKNDFSCVCTLARGSSDHAALFVKYLIENKIHKLVCSFSPSVCTQYKSSVQFRSILVLAISQSGQSDDLVQSLLYVKNSNALTVAFVNNEHSPLSTQSNYFVPLSAGVEQSVAATKSFLASLSRLIQFVGIWADDVAMLQGCSLLPKILNEVIATYRWDNFLPKIKNNQSMFVIGRGYGFPIAQEAALKFKETCGIHAEAISGAEVLHGPFELVNEKFCTFVFLQKDETLPSMLTLLERITFHKTRIFVVGSEEILSQLDSKNVYLLPTLKSSLHPVLDLIIAIQCFYLFVGNLALLKGREPDRPKNLNKVTRTL